MILKIACEKPKFSAEQGVRYEKWWVFPTPKAIFNYERTQKPYDNLFFFHIIDDFEKKEIFFFFRKIVSK